MKRYIRLEDVICEPDGETEDGYAWLVKVKGGWNYLPKEPILKEADTIEELCDCLVYKQKGKYLPQVYFESPAEMLKDKQWVKAFVREMTKHGTEYWASIWLDGNLIKVAKLNEKGELELL